MLHVSSPTPRRLAPGTRGRGRAMRSRSKPMRSWSLRRSAPSGPASSRCRAARPCDVDADERRLELQVQRGARRPRGPRRGRAAGRPRGRRRRCTGGRPRPPAPSPPAPARASRTSAGDRPERLHRLERDERALARRAARGGTAPVSVSSTTMPLAASGSSAKVNVSVRAGVPDAVVDLAVDVVVAEQHEVGSQQRRRRPRSR